MKHFRGCNFRLLDYLVHIEPLFNFFQLWIARFCFIQSIALQCRQKKIAGSNFKGNVKSVEVKTSTKLKKIRHLKLMIQKSYLLVLPSSSSSSSVSVLLLFPVKRIFFRLLAALRRASMIWFLSSSVVRSSARITSSEKVGKQSFLLRNWNLHFRLIHGHFIPRLHHSMGHSNRDHATSSKRGRSERFTT